MIKDGDRVDGDDGGRTQGGAEDSPGICVVMSSGYSDGLNMRCWVPLIRGHVYA